MSGLFNLFGRWILAQPEYQPLADYTCRSGYGVFQAGLTG